MLSTALANGLVWHKAWRIRYQVEAYLPCLLAMPPTSILQTSIVLIRQDQKPEHLDTLQECLMQVIQRCKQSSSE